MSPILCIDFGTSSIRAALSEDGRVKPLALELGEAFSSSIDRASIPSAIFIDADGSLISFGEEALKRGLRGEASLLFELSPKRWMTLEPPTSLEREVIPRTGLTRKQLLAGLLAQSFSATTVAAGLSKTKLLKIETRVAHPVWGADTRVALGQSLRWITDIGAELCGVTDQAITVKRFLSEVKKVAETNKLAKSIDVEEPIAAALELFENSDNAREICVVIDVGAGTTDLGIFVSLTPDEQARGYRRKFIQAASPRSIYKAGDLIDEVLITLIKNRAKNIRSDTIQDLQRRRRNIKETLFSRVGKVYEAGVEVTLNDLENQDVIRDMGDELAINFSTLVDEASQFIRPFVEASIHRADRLNVVFAGGGSKIGFLQRAIGKRVEFTNGISVPVAIRPAETTGRALPASIERLAVALGGTTPDKYWPVTKLMSPGEMITQWDLKRRDVPVSGGELWSTDWWREQE